MMMLTRVMMVMVVMDVVVTRVMTERQWMCGRWRVSLNPTAGSRSAEGPMGDWTVWDNGTCDHHWTMGSTRPTPACSIAMSAHVSGASLCPPHTGEDLLPSRHVFVQPTNGSKY